MGDLFNDMKDKVKIYDACLEASLLSLPSTCITLYIDAITITKEKIPIYPNVEILVM